jgi:cob(I)alamin adenosyltransferase
MVVLSRIYTKTGDRGSTALGTGQRVPKDHLRIEAYGTVDELNSVLGMAISSGLDGESAGILAGVQNDLFDLGADLCVPAAGRRKRKSPVRRKPLRMTEVHTQRLEKAIDRLNAPLAPLRSFVLPGGTAPSAWLHLARTTARRAERRVVHLARRSKINPQVIIYLNRLSDLLFVMARRGNAGGKADILWNPGGTEADP